MNTAIYWIGVALSALGTGLAIWRFDAELALFPGLLTYFSFIVIWTTQYTRTRRENPKILVQRGAIGLLSAEPNRRSVVLVSNPGILNGTVLSIEYRAKRGGKWMTIDWSWQSLHPVLAPRPNTAPRSKLPAPLLPGGLLALYTPVEIDPVQDGATLRLEYKMGSYKKRTTRWRVEALL